jgi:RND family efflux transporter MFP subunit
MNTGRSKWVIALLVALLATAGCTNGASREEATPTPIPTPIVPTKPTYEVKRGEVVDSIEFTGRIAPVVEEELFFRAAGYIEIVYVKKDDWVKEGDVLAELEVSDLKNQLLQAETSLKVAQSDSEQQVAEAEANLRAAELRLAILRASDPAPQVVIAEVDLERAQGALAEAQEEYDKAKNRTWEWQYEHVQESYTNWLQEAEWNLQVAEAQYQQALQASQVHNYDIQIQQQEVALARLHLERLETGLDVEEIRLSVERLRAQLDDARLIAPFDGQVLSVMLSEGRAVEAHRSVMVVADPSELEVSAELEHSEVEELVEGMPVTVAAVLRPEEVIEGYIQRLPYPYGGGGRITTAAEEEDKSTRIALETMVAEAGYELGDRVRVTVVLERKEDVLWLPPQAIRTFEGRKFVVVEEAEGQRRVDVKLGIESEDRVEIEEGLTEGQTVIGP